MHSSLLLLASLLAGVFAVDYSGYKVLRATPKNDESVAFLNALNDKFDIWKESRGVGHSADILVAPRDDSWLSAKLEQIGIEIQTMIEDVQPLFDAQKAPSASATFDYDAYHPLDEILTWMSDFQAEHSNFAELEHVAYTYEGRDVQKLKLSSDLTDTSRPVFFMIGGTHSREWVTQATMMYVSKWLVDNYLVLRNDNLLDILEFHIIPNFNQDGYAYTWASGGDRLWRKTRKPSSVVCTGIDPNRNYDCEWGTGGSSSAPCAIDYMGPHPASEVEISDMQSHVWSIRNRVKIFMDVHAYGQYWMYPYGYEKRLPQDNADLNAASAAAVTAIQGVHGKNFEYGTVANVIYVASGSSVDWAYDVAEIKHSYALELRDKGFHGFTLPASQIKPAAEEFFAGVEALIEHLQSSGEL